MCRSAEMGLHPDKQADSETQDRHQSHAARVRWVGIACGNAVGLGAMS